MNMMSEWDAMQGLRFDYESKDDDEGLDGEHSDVDFDLLESGNARETLSRGFLAPLTRRAGTLRCHVIREGKDRFWLYRDSDDGFLLSAVRFEGNFYISQYEDFPNQFMGEHVKSNAYGSSFCAVMRLTVAKTYVLYNRVCESCDDQLGLHTCGGQLTHNNDTKDRQELLRIQHFADSVRAGSLMVDCNAVSVTMPMVYRNRSRDVWCARYFKRQSSSSSMLDIEDKASTASLDAGANTLGRSKPMIQVESVCDEQGSTQVNVVEEDDGIAGDLNTKAKAPHYSSSRRKHNMNNGGAHKFGTRMHHRPSSMHSYDSDEGAQDAEELAKGEAEAEALSEPVLTEHNGSLDLRTKRPRYDRVSGSLRLKFRDSRVTMASSKNLIFCVNDQSATAEKKRHNRAAAGDDAPVLQFGKASKTRFNLDYAFPLAPLQAFAMSLSLFNWQGPKRKK